MMKIIRILTSPLVLILTTIIAYFGLWLTIIDWFFYYHNSWDELYVVEDRHKMYLEECVAWILEPMKVTKSYIKEGKLY